MKGFSPEMLIKKASFILYRSSKWEVKFLSNNQYDRKQRVLVKRGLIKSCRKRKDRWSPTSWETLIQVFRTHSYCCNHLPCSSKLCQLHQDYSENIYIQWIDITISSKMNMGYRWTINDAVFVIFVMQQENNLIACPPCTSNYLASCWSEGSGYTWWTFSSIYERYFYEQNLHCILYFFDSTLTYTYLFHHKQKDRKSSFLGT